MTKTGISLPVPAFRLRRRRAPVRAGLRRRHQRLVPFGSGPSRQRLTSKRENRPAIQPPGTRARSDSNHWRPARTRDKSESPGRRDVPTPIVSLFAFIRVNSRLKTFLLPLEISPTDRDAPSAPRDPPSPPCGPRSRRLPEPCQDPPRSSAVPRTIAPGN